MADAAAGYLGVSGGDLAFTDSTTMGLGLVYGGVAARNPVATEHDFYATHEALRQLYGRLRRIRLYDDRSTAVGYTGSWTRKAYTYAANKTLTASSLAGSRASMTSVRAAAATTVPSRPRTSTWLG